MCCWLLDLNVLIILKFCVTVVIGTAVTADSRLPLPPPANIPLSEHVCLIIRLYVSTVQNISLVRSWQRELS